MHVYFMRVKGGVCKLLLAANDGMTERVAIRQRNLLMRCYNANDKAFVGIRRTRLLYSWLANDRPHGIRDATFDPFSSIII